MSSPEQFFEGSPSGLAIYHAVVDVVGAIGPADVLVSRSQIAFRARMRFAYVWRPDRYVRSDAAAVLSIALDEELRSARFKEVAHPAPGTWMHHLELRDPTEVDAEVSGWLERAYRRAG